MNTTRIPMRFAFARACETIWGSEPDGEYVMLVSADVFGRDYSGAYGRGHASRCCAGLMIGTNLRGGTVGGYEVSSGAALSSGINTTTGSKDNPDVPADETLTVYSKTILRAAGVPAERRDVRLPDSTEVVSIL